jgi:Arc/MetJ-type ribon-helix-helix transcriptional regulator
MSKSLHHLLRVRMKTTRFERLQEIASEESEALGMYVSVSDLVRIAIDNWLQTHDCKERLRQSLPKQKD